MRRGFEADDRPSGNGARRCGAFHPWIVAGRVGLWQTAEVT